MIVSMDIQEILNKAQELKKDGHLKIALRAYNDAFDVLIQEADKYAREIKGSIIDVGKLRTITPQLFEESKKYLRRDKAAAVISNNIGTIFAELGDYEAAIGKFKEAIELTPDGEDYTDPKIGLERVSELKDRLNG